MLRHYRRRYGNSVPSHVFARYVVLGIVCGVVVFAGGKKIASLIAQIGDTKTVAVVLHVPDRSSVQVSLDGGEVQRAENGLRLYPGDRLTIDDHAQGFVTFFDGSILALDENTELLINESVAGDVSSTIDVTLTKGNLWIQTPSSSTYTGSIVRNVHTSNLLVSLPSRAEGVVGERSLQVFTADGLGSRIEIPGVSAVGYIGEGQQFILPEGEKVQDNLYAYRSPLEETAHDSALVNAGKKFAGTEDLISGAQEGEDVVKKSTSADEILTVIAPENDTTVTGDTVQVQGSVGKEVRRIRINGYMVDIPLDTSVFTYELALPHDAEVSIVIEALDDKGIPLTGMQRNVRRDIEAPIPPSIQSPSASGTTYRTLEAEFEIRGSASPDTVGIIVNDYRLQLFVQGDPEWSYLASIELGNLQYGRNTYEVRAIDTSGNISAPAVLTILLEEGEEGIVQEAPNGNLPKEGAGDSEKDKQGKPVSEKLPENPPILPGSLRIVGPTEGEPFTATGSEFSIYGLAPEEAESIWVNGYRLRLYKPGEPIWKYIASYPLGTMKRGKNVYAIAIRNRAGEVLDQVNYTVYYRVE